MKKKGTYEQLKLNINLIIKKRSKTCNFVVFEKSGNNL